MEKIRQEELAEIKRTPAGKALWLYLERRVANLKDQWAEGLFNNEDPHICTTANVSAVHQLRAFQEIIDLEADDINQEIDRASQEQLGMAPPRGSNSPSGV